MGDQTLGRKWGTVESVSGSVSTLTLDQVEGALLTHVEGDPVGVSMTLDGVVNVNGAENDGEILLKLGDSIPIPKGAKKIEHKSTGTAKLWFIPDRV